jgi:predicted O-methyltransferase YrrM
MEDTLHFVSHKDIIMAPLTDNAIIRYEADFAEDYLVLHCLVRKYRPSTLFEIGTCEGVGTLILKNALLKGTVYSLDLPLDFPGEYHLTEENLGYRCYMPYEQLFGDSMTYDYSQHYPIDAWFIDGHHDYAHVYHESQEAVKAGSQLIMWHDTDMDPLFQAVLDVFADRHDYDVYRVSDTRVTYAVKRYCTTPS